MKWRMLPEYGKRTHPSDEMSAPAPVAQEGNSRQLLSDFLNKDDGLGFLTTVCAGAAKGRDIDASDLVQETIIRTIRFLERDVAHNMTNVLCTIAYRAADDLQRKKARQQKRLRHIADMSIVTATTDLLEQRIDNEYQQKLRKRLRAALKGVTPKRQRVVAMFRVWRCASNSHIARKLDVSRGTVLNDWHSACAQLDQLLPEYAYLFRA